LCGREFHVGESGEVSFVATINNNNNKTTTTTKQQQQQKKKSTINLKFKWNFDEISSKKGKNYLMNVQSIELSQKNKLIVCFHAERSLNREHPPCK
jgi:hypothetical protein